MSWAFAFGRRLLIRIFSRVLASLQVWCSDINFEQIYLRVVLHEWQRGLGGFAGGEVQSGRWAGGLFGPLASTTGGGRRCGSNTAVAAAATAAAAEAAAASKAAAAHKAAAKAAAAANERRALDVCTPSNKPDLPKEPGGGAGLMDGEGFSGGRCL